MTRAQRFAALRDELKRVRKARDLAEQFKDWDAYEIAARRVTKLRRRLRRGDL